MKSKRGIVLSALAAFVLLISTAPVEAQECGELPANPDRIEPAAEPDPDAAYENNEKGFAAFDAEDFHCAAWYQVQAYKAQPDPVLMQNVSNALLEAGAYDAAKRYAEKTLSMNPEPPEVEAANTVITTVNRQTGEYEAVSLADYEVDAIVVDFVRYEAGDKPLLPKGKVTVTAERQGQMGNETLQVPKPVEVVEKPVEPSSDGGLDWRFWTGLGVGVAGVALLGTTFGLDASASSKVEEYDDLRACIEASGSNFCPDDNRTAADYNRLGDEIEGLATIEMITLISGSILTAAGLSLIVWNLVDDGGSETQAAQAGDIQVDVSPRLEGGGQVGVTLTF